MLFIISTPIGNLKDITYRAVETLKTCDLILCEDTRTSSILLKTYSIDRPMISFHKFNEKTREDEIVEKLKEGKVIGLISDAGTPGICDPGAKLIKRCREENLPIFPIPGPCAITTALSLYGEEHYPFQFIGYLEKKEGALKTQLIDLYFFPGTSIGYDTPHHLLKTLTLLKQCMPNIKLFIAREMTKFYEEHIEGTPEKLLTHFETKGVKGELVLIFEKMNHTIPTSPQECVAHLETIFEISKKEAIVIAAKLLNKAKREIYDLIHLK